MVVGADELFCVLESITTNDASQTTLRVNICNRGVFARFTEEQLTMVLVALRTNNKLEDVGDLMSYLPVNLNDRLCRDMGKTLQGISSLTDVDLCGIVVSAKRKEDLVVSLLQKQTGGLRKLWIGREGPSACRMNDLGVESIAQVLQNNTTLESLALTYNGVTEVGTAALAAVLVDNTTLTDLDLAYNDEVDDAALIALLGTERKSPVCILGLASTGVKLEEGLFTDYMLRMLSGLQSLNLAGNKMWDVVLLRVLTTRYLGNLSALNLNATALTPELMVPLGEYMKSNLKLTKLNVGCNQLQGSTMVWAPQLEKNTMLTSLSLDHTKMGDNGLVAFATAVRKNTTLTSLTLSRCGVGKHGKAVTSLAAFLRGNHVVRVLDVSGCKLGQESIVELGRAIMETQRLCPVTLITYGYSDKFANYSHLSNPAVS
jgi:hypothetical protein